MTTPLDRLLGWVREREAIRVRKERGNPFPWTEDPILRDWRFCNVRREDDRVTLWVARNVRIQFAESPLLWLALCLCRQINWPPALAMLINGPYPGAWPTDDAFSPAILAAALEDMASLKMKVFTGAYIIPASSEKGVSKGSVVATRTIGRLWEKCGEIGSTFSGKSLERAHATLTKFDGWGPFLAYQAIVDMRFCSALLADARDLATWTAAGPGTIRGLNRLAGRPTTAPLSQYHARYEILPLFETIPRETGVAVDLSDIPNCLCEFDKYERVRLGEGTPRSRYVPGRGS